MVGCTTHLIPGPGRADSGLGAATPSSPHDRPLTENHSSQRHSDWDSESSLPSRVW